MLAIHQPQNENLEVMSFVINLVEKVSIAVNLLKVNFDKLIYKIGDTVL